MQPAELTKPLGFHPHLIRADALATFYYVRTRLVWVRENKIERA